MPLHMTKVAYGAQSLEEVHGWFKARGDTARLTTRYLPKRHEEMVGGSLFWILKHQLVARSEILGFEEAEGGRTHIVISTTGPNRSVRPRAGTTWKTRMPRPTLPTARRETTCCPADWQASLRGWASSRRS